METGQVRAEKKTTCSKLAVFWILDYGNWSGKGRKELEFVCFM